MHTGIDPLRFAPQISIKTYFVKFFKSVQY